MARYFALILYINPTGSRSPYVSYDSPRRLWTAHLVCLIALSKLDDMHMPGFCLMRCRNILVSDSVKFPAMTSILMSRLIECFTVL